MTNRNQQKKMLPKVDSMYGRIKRLFDESSVVDTRGQTVMDTPFYHHPPSTAADVSSMDAVEPALQMANPPLELRTLYALLGSVSKELAIGPLTLFSLGMVARLAAQNRELIDVGVIYLGMGHVLMLSYQRHGGRSGFVLRCDGGSSDIDVEHNEQRNQRRMRNPVRGCDFFDVVDVIKKCSDADEIYAAVCGRHYFMA